MTLANFQALVHFRHSYEALVEVSCPLFLLGWQFFLYCFDQVLYIFWIQVCEQFFFLYLVQIYYIQMEMTENGVRSKVKIMASSGQDMIDVRLL